MHLKLMTKGILPVLLVLLLSQCNIHKDNNIANPDYNPDIAAFTSGLISNESFIRIQLSADYPRETDPEKPVDKSLFEFSPSLKGDVYWIDQRTLEFRPSEKLPPGTAFTARFRLSELYQEKKKNEDFEFSFNTIPLDLSVDFRGIRPYSNSNLKWNSIKGMVRTSDKVSLQNIESLIEAEQDRRKLSLKWEHHEEDHIHYFTIDSVERKESSEFVRVSWNGKPFGLDVEGERKYEVPALGSFVLMEHKIVQQPEQHIVLRFSDPIRNDQSLDGLIRLSNQTDLKFTIEENEIRVYPSVRQYGTLDMNIEPGIRNILNYKYNNSQVLTLNFEEMKPAVRLVGNGVIIPDSRGLLFPFEAVNLKAVDVKVIKIFEDNVAQFLQVNQLNGSSELRRAGRLILKKTVDLIPERAINFGEWNAFSLDLSELIKTEPGAIYRVELSFRKKHSLYSCPDADETDQLSSQENEFEEINEDEIAYWDGKGYGYNNYHFNWNERNDPCSESYYNYYERKVARNVIASNFGIIAKAGEDKSMLFAITDLRTTEPIGGVTLNIYNYQQQLLASLTTNNEGIAKVKLENTPYLLIASKNDQKGYLRLDQNSAISLGQFDISGARTQKGVKGFLYGERGVWRPGDTLHLTFILEDRDNNIPDDHPVEFELTDPRGKVKKKITRTSGINGFYSFNVATDADDPTGSWSARIRIGGISFYKSLRVETVKPNRLKIKLNFGEDTIYSSGGKINGKLLVRWLHGATAGNLKARVEVSFNSKSTGFEGYDEYKFTDRTKYFNPVEKVVFEGNLDERGEASFSPDLDLDKRAPGMVNATFIVRAFEPGGDFSISQTRIPYSPYPAYVGLKKPQGDRYGLLQTDTLQEFRIVSLDEKGEPVSRRELEVRVYKLGWRWWWHTSNENLASYSGRSGHNTVFSKKITTNSSGEGSFKMKVDYPEWGRFLVIVSDPEGGHSASETVYFDWPGWAGRASRKDPQSASILPFSSDKSSYNVGETARITVPTSDKGRILLSIESGTKVLSHYWIKAVGKETSFSFTVTEEMAPNIYVNVSLIQPHDYTKNDLPVRMYGVIPILVEDPATHLSPVVTMPEVLKPETSAEITVSEKNGKAMTYTIALVDEGLLDLTNFSTPDPWRNFYVKEALGVKTFDLYDYVLGAFGGRIDGVFSIGGGDEANAEPKKSANRFPPMVKFMGPFQLAKGKKNKHEVNIPNYVGSVRTMVIAGQDAAYGSEEKTVPVRKPLMVLTTLPRVLSPGETVNLPVTIFAMEEKVKKVEIEVEANDQFSLSENKRIIYFNETGDTTINFEVNVKERLGIGKITTRVKSGSEKASHEIELDVRSPNPVVTDFIYGVIEKGEIWEKEVSLPGMKGTNTGILEVSSMPPMDFGRRLKYLIRYPHGCIEQTVSAAFPQLYLADVMDVDENFEKVTADNIKAAIERLGTFIQSSGGFGYWPSSTTENDWGSNYAGHFLLEAKDKGFNVPESWLKNWIRYQRKTARNWKGMSYQSSWHRRDLELIQAYRLYTLALAGEPEMGAMNRLRERSNLYSVAKWRLAAAYALAGQPEMANKLVRSVTTEVDNYVTSPYTYGSPVRDKALVLETMTLLGLREEAVPVIRYISERLSSNRWYSTQSTAYSLLAVAKFMGKGNTSKELNYRYQFGDDKSVSAVTQHPVSQVHRDFGNKPAEKVRVSNNGAGTLFVRLSVSGTPLAGKETAKSQNLGMSIEYKTLNGKRIDVSKLAQGTDFLAVVNVKNPGTLGYYSDMALSQIFPSGWEIQNMRMFASDIGNYDTPMYQDIRDDRIYSYFNLGSNQSKSFAVKLTATYRGRFYLPGVSCDAMYRNDINAVVPGQWVEVVQPGAAE